MIQTFDVRQMIEQLLRSLRLKCKGLKKLPFNSLFKVQIFLFDEGIVEGFEHLVDEDSEEESDSDNETKDSDSSDDELLSLWICGQNDNKVTDDKKLKAYIKSVVKTEKCEQDLTGIKTESSE